MAQLSGSKWEFALNTERQLNVKTATVHEEVNKVNSPLLHFELIDRGNNLLYHSLVSLLKSWPWNRWSDEGELETRELTKHRNKLKNCITLTANNSNQARKKCVCMNRNSNIEKNQCYAKSFLPKKKTHYFICGGYQSDIKLTWIPQSSQKLKG